MKDSYARRRRGSRAEIALTAVLALFMASRAAVAESRAGTLVLDPSRTLIEFRLPGTLHTTHGTFRLTRGTIKADPSSGIAEGEIVVDATSGDSGLGARDSRMKDDILEAQKYPEIVFRPHHIEGRLESGGDFHAKLDGTISIHGADHQLTIDADGHLSGDDVAATCHFSVPYVEWGMKDPSLPLLSVSNSVDIDIAAAGKVVWAAQSASHAAYLGRN